jgi:hypothetical protein
LTTAIATAIGRRRETEMTAARMFLVTAAILALGAAPAATAARGKRVAVEATMTLHRLGSRHFQLDIENTTPLPVVFTRITWTAPAGVKVRRITGSRGGRCKLSGGGFRCTTQLASPSCLRCAGDALTVRFDGTGPGRRWIPTRSGGYWLVGVLHTGHAVIVASPARTEAARVAVDDRSRGGVLSSRAVTRGVADQELR